ncbi:MAG: amidotransferase [Spirochaetaceae bacterium]|nr:MAG: amidotransferase [Spirochaetaceae bacterium]
MTGLQPRRRAHVLQHVPFEGLGSIEPWLVAAGYSITWTRFFESEEPPRSDDIDLVIALGGPMSVNDEAAYPWLRAEKRFVRDSIEAGTAVLGVCLGAQLIAAAMGARVYPNRHREIGWFPVERVQGDEPEEPGSSAPNRPAAGKLSRALPDSFDAFHWHGETFDLPAGATHLARSDACEHQAFALGPSVVGLQFHLETTRESARSLVDHCRDELTDGPYVQTEATIVSAPVAHYARINALMAKTLRIIVG